MFVNAALIRPGHSRAVPERRAASPPHRRLARRGAEHRLPRSRHLLPELRRVGPALQAVGQPAVRPGGDAQPGGIGQRALRVRRARRDGVLAVRHRDDRRGGREAPRGQLRPRGAARALAGRAAGQGPLGGPAVGGPEQRQPQQVRLGGWVLAATFERGTPASLADGSSSPRPPRPGRHRLRRARARTGPDEFIVAGTAVTITFAADVPGKRAGILSAEEGRFVGGAGERPLAERRRDPPRAPRAARARALLDAEGEALPLLR